LPDEQLLDRFLGTTGGEAEAAFRAVVTRHGPMVLGVCRHILNQQQDAEDAFQATFLVLARKADSIKDRRVLGRWLYEVAYRIAIRAKTNLIRRRTHERQGAEMAVTTPETDAGWSELRPVLHEEVNRLPEKYRAPVILCYLEGKTNEEVAHLLQWPVGTVKGRLSRARELLRTRLTRRGLTLSAAFLVTALSRNSVFAEAVPSRLIDATVETAMNASKAGALASVLDLPDEAPATPLRSLRAWGVPLGVAIAFLVVVAGVLAGTGRLFPAVVRVGETVNSIVPVFQSAATPTSCH
jgi:RNA polymerase sigma factor (sigma-70 family)